jgi:hypothetical protein
VHKSLFNPEENVSFRFSFNSDDHRNSTTFQEAMPEMNNLVSSGQNGPSSQDQEITTEVIHAPAALYMVFQDAEQGPVREGANILFHQQRPRDYMPPSGSYALHPDNWSPEFFNEREAAAFLMGEARGRNPTLFYQLWNNSGHLGQIAQDILIHHNPPMDYPETLPSPRRPTAPMNF